MASSSGTKNEDSQDPNSGELTLGSNIFVPSTGELIVYDSDSQSSQGSGDSAESFSAAKKGPPRSSIKGKWGDLESSDDEVDFGSELKTSSSREPSSCCPDVGKSNDKLGALLTIMQNYTTDPHLSNLKMGCVLNVIANCNYWSVKLAGSASEEDKANILDSYLRFRHELLARQLSNLLQLGVDTTDQKFSDLLPINSKRTPDFIKVINTRVIIIEVSAVTDIERGASIKGDSEYGYKSKYENEITELTLLGYSVSYHVVLFDISDHQNVDHESKLITLCKMCEVMHNKILMEEVNLYRVEFCNGVREINKLLGKQYSILFNEPFNPKILCPDFKELEYFGEPVFEYKGRYNRVGVSAPMYSNVHRQSLRMQNRLIQFMSREDHQISISYDVVRTEMSISKKQGSPSCSEWLDWFLHSRIDKVCENLKVVLSGTDVSPPKPDYEFFSYSPLDDPELKQAQSIKEYYSMHLESYDIKPEYTRKNYSERIINNNVKSLCSIYEDEDYEAKILRSIRKSLKGDMLDEISSRKVTPFAAYSLDAESISAAVEGYSTSYVKLNVNTPENYMPHVKQPFIYPLYSASEKSYGNFSKRPGVLSYLTGVDLGPFTNMLVNVASKPSFVFGTVKGVVRDQSSIRKKLSDLQTNINSRLKQLYREGGYKRFPKMKELDDHATLKDELSKLNKVIRADEKADTAKLSLIKVSSKKNTDTHNSFKAEMKHFKGKKTGKLQRGVGILPSFEVVSSAVETLKEVLLSPSPCDCPDGFIDKTVSDDVSLLKDLKNEYMSKYEPFMDFVKATNLYHSCAFISRLCHTLLYHSQTSLNNQNICVDNLGYDDVVLFVRGGKKIFSTRKTKLFRLIMPTYHCVNDLYSVEGVQSSMKFVNFNGRKYLITPWMNFHETVVTDGLTFLHRIIGFSTLLANESLNFKENMNSCIFNILLAFHNRRQTETFLHNLRYIIMNSMSDFTAVQEILPEMAGFNYDCFQFFIRECMKNNFFHFSTTLKKLHDEKGNRKFDEMMRLHVVNNMFTGSRIRDSYDLATSVYSTYLMSKAPTNQTLEQVSNWRSMLKTHKEYEDVVKIGSIQKTVDDDDIWSLPEYYDKLMESDFNFDPKYCVLLGKFMGDYLSTMTTEGELSTKWEHLLNRPWDNFSNTKGLRGEDNADFFGSKGYYVVYKKILEENPELTEKVENLVLESEKGINVRKKLSEMNETYRERLNKEEINELIFHVVDKKQRGGQREIYVMDRKTKLCQQPIEDFLKEMCKLVPNEVISVPSNKRLSTIHSKVFEGKSVKGDAYYMVMDCRKWAPKSIIKKFILFLSGMRSILPTSFLVHCYRFFHLLQSKKIYTRPHIKDQLSRNRSTEDSAKYFIEDPTRKGYFIVMEYSWVMGIFNYFSSFVHVAAQLHIGHICRRAMGEEYGQEVNLHMIAHSDDSAGKLIVEDKHSAMICLYIYEILMKASNHLISKKKSNCGRVYYEFLSILYIDSHLLSMVTKFAGLFNFHPSDKGYCTDINDAYSRCIELVLNGSTFDQAYIGMKIQSNLIRRFYFQTKHSSMMYNYPPKMLGAPDAHPIMVLLCGSDADTYRIFRGAKAERKEVLVSISECLSTDTGENEGFLKPFDCSPKVRASEKIKKITSVLNEDSELKLIWTIQNVDLKNTSMNLLKFLYKLADKNFLASLQDESLTRRLSRAYHFRSSMSVNTKYGEMSYEGIYHLLSNFELFLSEDKIPTGMSYKFKEDVLRMLKSESTKRIMDMYTSLFEINFSEPNKLCRYLDEVVFRRENIVTGEKTTKPLHIKINQTVESSPHKYNVNNLVSWIKDPEMREFLPDTRNYHSIELYVKEYVTSYNLDIDLLTHSQLSCLLQKMERRSIIEYYCYSNVPSNMREVVTYQDLLNLISHNSFKGKYIEGLAIQFGRSMGVVQSQIMKELSDERVQWTMSFVLLIGVLSGYEQWWEVSKLDVRFPKFLGRQEYGKMKNLMHELSTYWSKEKDIQKYLLIDLECCRSNLERRRFDTKKLDKGCFNSFVKQQQLVSNIWMGTANLLINLSDFKMNVIVKGTAVVEILTQSDQHNFTSKDISYINLCLNNGQIGNVQTFMMILNFIDRNNIYFGVDKDNHYRIDKGENLIAGIPVTLNLGLSTILSNAEIGVVRTNKRGKIWWELKTEFESYKYKINTIPVEPSNSLEILENFFMDNEENKNLLRGMDSGLVKEVNRYCMSGLSIDLKIENRELINSYSLSRLHKVLSHCKRKGLCNVYPTKIEKRMLPAPDGGILNALICYSCEEGNDLEFDWDRELTPSYIRLKSTQPEAFVTSIMQDIKEKYDSLYSKEDKSIITKELIKLGKSIGSKSEIGKTMTLLCSWGYIGVSGSLHSLKNEVTAENFMSIREYPKGDVFFEYFRKTYIDFIKCIYEAGPSYFDEVRVMTNETSIEKLLTLNRMSFRSFMCSHVFTDVLCMMTGRNNRPSRFETHTLIFNKILRSIISIDKSRKKLEEELQKNPLLSQLPVSPEFLKDWMRVYETLKSVYRQGGGKIEELQINKPLDGVNIYKEAEKVLTELGFNFNPQEVRRSLRHQSVLSGSAYFDLISQKKLLMGKQLVVMDVDAHDLKTIKKVELVSFSTKFFLKHQINEDMFDGDDEFDEVLYELETSDPDLDSLESLIEENKEKFFKKTPSKRIKAVYKGKMHDAVKFKLNILFEFNKTKKRVNPLSFIRQAGEHVMLVTDSFISLNPNDEYLKSCGVYRMVPKYENERSLLLTEMIIVYIFSSFKNTQFWQDAFNIIKIKPEELVEISKINSGEVLTAGGAIINYGSLGKMTPAELVLDKNREIEEERKMKEKEEMGEGEAEEVDKFEDIKKLGIPEEHVKQLVELDKEEGVSAGDKKGTIMKYINSLLNNKKTMDEIIKKNEDYTDQALKGMMTSDQLEQIYQIPLMLGVSRRKESDKRLHALKDREMIAEANSIAPGFLGRIVSGYLTMSSRTLKRFSIANRRWRDSVYRMRTNKEGKMFAIGIACLMANDAAVVDDPDPNDEAKWDDLMHLIWEILDEGEDSSTDSDKEEEDILYTKKPGSSSLTYKPLIERLSRKLGL